MEILFKLVLWVHLVSIAIGGAASFGIPALLGLVAKAEPMQRPVFGQAIMRLAAIGRMGVALLIVTGVLMVSWKYGGVAELSYWFWLKMLLVLCLIGLVIFNIFNGRKLRAGDAVAAARAPELARLGMALLAGIVLTAVLAFG